MLCMICATGISCQEKEHNYEVLVCSVIDSTLEGVNIQPDIDNWVMSKHVDETVNPDIIVSAFGMNMNGVYSHSTKAAGNSNKTAHYTQNNGNSFLVDSKTGRLIGYNWRNDDRQYDKKLPNDQLERIARDMLGTIVDTNAYESTIEWLDDWDMYHIQFVKKMDGILTTDKADLYLLPDGTPSMYLASSLGLISTDISLSVDYDAAEKSVRQELDSLYQDIRDTGKYDDIRFVIDDETITVLDDGSYAIIYSVDVYFVNNYDETHATEHGNAIGSFEESHIDLLVPIS